jgi:predicted transposase YdaD
LQQNKQLVELESLLGLFASFVLDTELVQQIMRWDVTVLRESPWYLEIQQESRQEGVQEGAINEAQSLILRQLSRRVGTLPTNVKAQVQALELPKLEALGEALLDFAGVDDLVGWLRSHQSD